MCGRAAPCAGLPRGRMRWLRALCERASKQRIGGEGRPPGRPAAAGRKARWRDFHAVTKRLCGQAATACPSACTFPKYILHLFTTFTVPQPLTPLVPDFTARCDASPDPGLPVQHKSFTGGLPNLRARVSRDLVRSAATTTDRRCRDRGWPALAVPEPSRKPRALVYCMLPDRWTLRSPVPHGHPEITAAASALTLPPAAIHAGP